MTNFKTLGITGIATAIILLIAQSAFAADTALWTSLSASGKISDALSLQVTEELRFSDIASPDLASQRTDITLSTSPTDWLTTDVGYKNTNSGEHRPYVGVRLKVLDAAGVSVTNRTRMELRLQDTETWRARSRATATLNDGLAGVTPSLSDEVFVGEDGLSENRATLGVNKPLTDNVSVNLSYTLRSQNGDGWSHAHVVGVGVGVSL